MTRPPKQTEDIIHNQAGSIKQGRMVSIGQAAHMLGVSVDTVRRWDKSGKVKSERLNGNKRHFAVKHLEELKSAKKSKKVKTIAADSHRAHEMAATPAAITSDGQNGGDGANKPDANKSLLMILAGLVLMALLFLGAIQYVLSMKMANLTTIVSRDKDQSVTTVLPIDGGQDGDITDESITADDIENGAITYELLSADVISAFLDRSTDNNTVNIDNTYVSNSADGGDITSVSAGRGLSGGGNSGDVVLSVNAGKGLVITDDILNVDLSTTGLTSTTTSRSGLELTGSGLSLLKGCGDGEILKWNGVAQRWQCDPDANSSIGVAVRESDGSPTNLAVTTFEFGPDTNSSTEFIVTNQGANTSRVRLGTSVLTTSNFTTNLDGVYVNVDEAPAAGDITGLFSSGLIIGPNSVALGADTTGNYLAGIIAGNGLSGSASGEGITPTLNIDFISALDGIGMTSSNSGFELGGLSGDQLALLQGCADSEVLKWDNSLAVWACAADSTGSADTLQTSYANDSDGGDAIISETAADGSLIIRNPLLGGSSSGYALFVDQLQAGTADALRVDNFGNGRIGSFRTTAAGISADGLVVEAANILGIITDAIDVSDAEIVNAINIGANDILSNGVSISSAELNVLDSGIDEVEVIGEIESILAGNGLNGGGTAGAVSLDIDLLAAADGIGVTSSNSGLELSGSSSESLSLIQGCADAQVLKWDNTNALWQCASDIDTSSSSFATIDTPGGTDPVADSGSDILQLLASGTNLTITGADGPESVTFNIDEAVLAGAGLAANGPALDIGAGNGIIVNANDISIDAATIGLTATTSSNSGLETTATGLRMLGGCADTQILKWDALGLSWDCANDETGIFLTTLQTAYAQGNSIITTDNRNIAFVLSDTLNDSNFAVTTASGSTGNSSFTLANGAGLAGPSELVLIDNQDLNLALANGLTVQSAAGGITTGLNVSDAEIVNAINTGANSIIGTTAAIDFSNFDVSASGSITLASGQSLSSAGALSLLSGTNSDLTFDAPGTGNIVLTGFSSCSALETNASNQLVCGTDDVAATVSLDAVSAAVANGVVRDSNANSVNWNWDFTSAGVDSGLSISESSASTNGLQDQQALFELLTLGGSTASPLQVTSGSGDVGDIFFDLAGSGDLEFRDQGVAFVQFLDNGSITLGKASANSVISIGDGTAADTITIGGGSGGSDAISIGNSSGSTSITLDRGASGTISLPDYLNCTALETNGSGQLLCGSDDTNSGTATVVEKEANEQISGSAAMQNDDHLLFTMNPNTAYVFEIFARYTSGGTADFKYGFDNLPAGATIRAHGESFNTSGNEVECSITNTSNTCVQTVGAPHDWTVMVRGIVQTSATGGTFNFRWAQNTPSVLPGQETTVYKNSILRYTTLAGAADLAETYYTNDSSINAGDLVSLDSGLQAGVRKSSGAYDSNTIGVVSTKPALLIGDAGTSGLPVPVALSGRVPVKVSNENGPIRPGDMLTASSTPGVAMRATSAGRTVGTAMTGFDGQGVGMVTAFVGISNGDGDFSAYFGDGGLTSADSAGFGSSVLTALRSTRSTNSVTLSDINADRIVAGLELVTPKVTTDKVVTQDISALEGQDISFNLADNQQFIFKDASGSEIGSLDEDGNLNIKGFVTAAGFGLNAPGEEVKLPDSSNPDNQTSGELDLSNLQVGALTVELDLIVQSALQVEGPATFARAVRFKSDVSVDGNLTVAGQILESPDSAGYAIIADGERRVHVAFAQTKPFKPIISITMGSGSFSQYRYTNVTATGFDIELAEPASQDIEFSWTASLVQP